MNALIAAIQLLIAAAFVSIPLVRDRYGARSTAGAHAELGRQGVPAGVLAENGMRFDAGGHETAAPAAVAAVMVTLAGMNLFGSDLAHTLTWVFQPLVLAMNALILYSNRTAIESVRKAFQRKGDPQLARIDVPALLKAAEDGFPRWTWTLANVRHVVVFGGSAVILAALFMA